MVLSKPSMRRLSGASSARFSAAARRRSARDCRPSSLLRAIAIAAAGAEHQAAVIVEVAVERLDLAVGDEPQPVGAGFQQVAVVGHHDHGAGIFVDRLDQRGAAVDVEMVGGLVEHDEVRPLEGGEAEQQPRLLAARQVGDRRVGHGGGKADRAGAGAHLRLRRVGHQLADVIIGAGARD